ncbi:DUF4328 domain-containing protein [Streptomyces silvisoli]|uniref:DUF4328 domain-containing protein n=1 Tax=Streptomyces silvisoli TaxID=3034235 RepID=A0ABT5ZL63_9ACTN|nr:DUF4328 domain-containing protein [Streptomyces silvisoli]MDF3290569.1 DUF4328 domain-containing protein [Streptomyces silvisoli]
MSYSPAGAPPGGGPAIRQLDGLATAVTVLLAVVAGIDLFAVYADLNAYSVVGNALSVTHQEVRQADDLYRTSGILQICGTLATAAVFIPWLYRARVNAEAFSRAVCTMGRGWVIGAWFVPFGNLWLPFRAACEVWDASAQSAPDRSWRHVSRAPVRAWWATWVTAVVVGRIGATLGGQTTLDALKHSVATSALADVLNIAAAVLAIVFVQKLTRMQRLKTVPGPVAFV